MTKIKELEMKIKELETENEELKNKIKNWDFDFGCDLTDYEFKIIDNNNIIEELKEDIEIEKDWIEFEKEMNLI